MFFNTLRKTMSKYPVGTFISGGFGKQAFDILTTDEGANFVKGWNANDPDIVDPILYKWLVKQKISWNSLDIPEFDPMDINE